MPKELNKIYEPAQFEDAIYAKWEKSGFFNPDNLTGDPFSILMPPPNVTGVLHLGHALENSLMDIMARYQRMQGKKVLLIPGTDHAAVATQAKVEKILFSEGIKNPRQELGREKLLTRIREYAENSKATILSQVRKMGTSCDWSRLAYTFDEARSQAVNEVFVKMYSEGLIYRGYRVINWSVKGQSTCSDDELVHVERPAKLYTFKYSADFPMSIATTRPETKLGDTAVAVNPQDKRYAKFIGQTFTANVGALKPLQIKIIADENIDPSFGTGAVGVTPAHSPVDFVIFEKQKALGNPIELIPVIDKKGEMTENAGPDYAGLSVQEARDKFLAYLKEQELLEKEEDIIQNVGTSDRFGDVVEALPMTQWFVDVNKKIPAKNKSLKELMLEAVSTGHNGDSREKINITPERFEKVYFSWIENLRDWCISRQIWWGHRIPVWYRGEEIFCGVAAPEGEDWEQDSDTLDTWFSSGLWTFSTLGWPSGNTDLKNFHPTSWMQMGYEIIFFWMARMILMSTYTLDQIPFRNVYIHGMLRSESGQKFSKSSGNNIDPLEVISKFGTDALRLSLISGITPGNDSKFYDEKVENSRNFVNKIWNISRYILSSTSANSGTPKAESLLPSDHWILQKFSTLIQETGEQLEKYQFSQAAEKLTDFTWNDLADWYLEVAKFESNKETKDWILQNILRDLLKLWHPFIPFVTETIWGEFNDSLLMVEKWPTAEIYEISKSTESTDFEIIKNIVITIRNARSENKIEPAKKIKALLYAKDRLDFLQSQTILIQSLRTGIESLEIMKKGEKVDNAIFATTDEVEIYLLDAIDTAKEKLRLEKEIANLEKYIITLESKLNNVAFTSKAPESLVSSQKAILLESQTKLAEIQKHLQNLK
jgi:valyl-tRNA synthetase